MNQLVEFVTNHPFLVSAAIALAVLLVVNEVRLAGRGNLAVSPDQAVQLINRGALVIDLRSRDAYEAGHLTNARHFGAEGLEELAEKFRRFQDKPILAYDDRGSLGTRAATALRKQSFEKAYALRGGISAWMEEHLPLEKGAPKKKAGSKRA